ncbi:ATP-binding protein [Marinoscillum sp. MHG1-6]|uniref:ATP-binding protein n=1 Tax=Marinoscillum sp. MHG1-6 TaxID=2959627 RepID=UPI002158562F|nr:ATP-binding protein [Marinoscillum sp. MHG1-6]
MSYQKVRFKLLIFFVLGVCAVIFTVTVLNTQMSHYIAKHKYVAELINIAGRQRMLSQNIAKNTALIISGNKTTASLDSLAELLDRSHYYLSYRKDTLDMSSVQKHRFDSLFNAITPHFTLISQVSDDLINQNDSVKAAVFESVIFSESRFLPLMDAITKEFEVLARNKLDDVNQHTLWSNVLITFAVFISGLIVFLVTAKSVKLYSNQLRNIQDQLKSAVSETNTKIEKLEFLTSAIKVGVWEYYRADDSEKWSDELYNILGYQTDELKGTFSEFLERTHPDDQQKLLDASDASRRTGIPSTIEIRVLTKHNGYKWVEATGNVRRDELGRTSLIMGGVIDIHGRKMLENQLKVFVENAPAAIAMLNKNMEYTAISNRWITAYRLEGRLLIGKSHYEIFPEISDEWKEIHQRCLKGSVEKRDVDRFDRANGETQWVKWEVRPWFISDNEIGGIIMFTEDITQEIEREEELKKAKDQAELASKTKEEFLATMSHEIRTPLNAVSGLSQILLSDTPKPEQIDNLNLLKFSADNLLNLINDILDISKIESGKLALEVRAFDFKYLVQNVKRSLDFRARENIVEVVQEYDKSLPETFIGDATRVTQIIYNLAGNAIKFTRKGKVFISVTKLSEDDKQCTMRVSIKDNGIGISQENQEKIFESFTQAEAGTTRQYGGTGLGLYITRRLLQMMDSEIQLISELGQGSEFFFDLTLTKSNEKIDITTDLEENVLPERSRNMKILVAEDNKANQLIIQTLLKKAGVQFTIVSDGKEAVEKAKTKNFDLILMDLQMPIMGGFEATYEIRKETDTYFQRLPIIALTADAFSNIKEKAEAIGMNGYLTKPYNISDLYHLIDKYGKLNRNEKEIY